MDGFGVGVSHDAEDSGPGIADDLQRRICHHAFERFMRGEFAGDRLSVHAVDHGGGVDDLLLRNYIC